MRTHCLDCKEFLKPKEFIRCSICKKNKQAKQIQEAIDRKKQSILEWQRTFRKPNTNKYPELNAIYVRPSNTIIHELEKTKLAMEHRKLGHTFITEAQREDKKVEDFICYECGTIEIFHTSGDLERYQREGTQVRKV